MKNSPNIYLTLIVIGIIVFSVNRFKDKKEHFGNPLSLLKKIGQGMVDFFLNFIDILLVIADVFSFIAVIPFIFMDLIMILITWLNPISMIKSVVSSIFIITKILLLSIFDIIAHIARMFFAKIFGFLAGGLWGIPHTPEQHRTHNEIETGFADKFGDHHHDHDALHLNDPNPGGNNLYRPLRCYKSVGSEGWVNMIATIICPPLGVFMAFGVKGYMKIIVCSVLSLAYYIPGLVYALLITTHLGLGRHITAKDCGGIVNYGIRIAGCSTINNQKDCEAATIPGWIDANGNPIRACGYDRNATSNNKCFNIIYPSAIHTTGSEYRYDGEIGLGWHPGGQTDNGFIDKRKELAYDKTTGTYGGRREQDSTDDVNYNPMLTADSYEKTGDLDPDDQIPIPKGPWTFVGD
jgi:uncharacterized membrane protein YqaE (UPF0057 family)